MSEHSYHGATSRSHVEEEDLGQIDDIFMCLTKAHDEECCD